MLGHSETSNPLRSWRPLLLAAALFAVLAAPGLAQIGVELPAPEPSPEPEPICQRIVTADVVALDQVYYWNRLGAFEPQGMIYALRRDVVHKDQKEDTCLATQLPLTPGKVRLRQGKRPRPLVLRANAGDCLRINFTNLLATSPADEEQPHTRTASIHAVGMQYLNGPGDGGINVGTNSTGGVVAPGASTTYMLYAQEEGTYLMYSGAAMNGGEGESGSISPGLFGAINVQAKNAEWYRSQVTQDELARASSFPDASGFPVVNYDALYPALPPYCHNAGKPILSILDSSNRIVHSDLTAIITGPNRGPFPSTTYPQVHYIYPNRNQAFREFTIIFHDEIGAVQAFPHFEDEILSHTLHSARDAFAINYGTGGAGAEVLANRLKVGPMHDCVECKYEEFFLTSWAVGDPAMVVDVPANDPCAVDELKEGRNCTPTMGPKATKALYPEDPSNVYHSYLNDHVKFRNLHAGSDDHHIFHLHAHQWLHSPNSDKSAYLDSQAIGQGGAFTYEIAYEGSGNRNKTAGDSIFHCHFYPHFAQGMWSMWRVHDVLELGTELDGKGRPVHETVTDPFGNTTTITTTRALPDGEIAAGTPIPAIVPIPRRPMPPVPGPIQLINGDPDLSVITNVNPGYPFWIPGDAGHRPPHPPLDTIHDGGLPRHIITDGVVAIEEHTRLSFRKELGKARPLYLSEAGEPVEDVAMNFHAQANHPTRLPEGGGASFDTNGAPRQPGAPYADPCMDDFGNPIPIGRTYKAADIEMDIVLNKAGWHFPQQRLITLWSDVGPTLAGQRPPEPFFFRANSEECIEYQLTNLVPKEYQVDDFEVRTPTDILGQHIHLVKFDVTSSDGGGNGFNYEDGTFSPEEVQERIEAIRANTWPGKATPCAGTITGGDPRDGQPECPVAEQHPYFATIGLDVNCNEHDDWLGAQTTVQRWWADPVWDNDREDRTLHTIFTHDHFGPSTHQQTGLYAGLIIEPPGATWYENEGTGLLGGGFDGGPTSWQARIVSSDETYREFLVEFGDFQHAYERNEFGPPSPGDLQVPTSCPHPTYGYANPRTAINPPGRKQIGLPFIYEKPQFCPTNACDPDGPIDLSGLTSVPAPCPEAFSADDPGTAVVNYRNEPVAMRVRNPSTNQQAGGEPGDLSFVYESRTDRADGRFNVQLNQYPPLTSDLDPGDPYTPLFRAYEEDQVHIRVLVGAHEEEHNFGVHGVKWLFEPDDPNSGYRASQMMGISEWFDFEVPRMPSLDFGESADFLYKPSASADFQWNGAWGLLRLYRGARPDLPTLPDNLDGASNISEQAEDELFDAETLSSDVISVQGAGKATVSATTPQRILCPKNASRISYDIVAVSAAWALPAGTLEFNRRDDRVDLLEHTSECPLEGDDPVVTNTEFGPLHDPTAIMFFHRSDLDANYRLRPGFKVEPLILRAKAGDCIAVTLYNALPDNYTDLDGYSAVPNIVERFNQNQVDPSLEVGLHPQLVTYDIRQGDGANVGMNRANYGYKQTVAPGQTITYYWYAGQLLVDSAGNPTFDPIEYGATALVSSDPIKHTNKGAIGALIIEPTDASWSFDFEADNDPSGISSEDIVMTRASATVSSGGRSFKEYVVLFQDDLNMRYADGDPIKSHAVNEDAQETGQQAFNYRTEPIWFRMGYAPETDPGITRTFTNFDRVLLNSFVGSEPETPIFRARAGVPIRFRVVHPGGDTQNHTFEVHGHLWQETPYINDSHNLGDNLLSNWHGAQDGVGSGKHFDALLDTAGGRYRAKGDYLYRDYVPWAFGHGLWGLLRVVPTGLSGSGGN